MLSIIRIHRWQVPMNPAIRAVRYDPQSAALTANIARTYICPRRGIVVPVVAVKYPVRVQLGEDFVTFLVTRPDR